jgi:Arc/MetJ family transcription regulator
MRTTLVVDDALFPELMSVTRAHTKTEAVRVALEGFLKDRRTQALLALRGKLDLQGDLDELRTRDARGTADE